MWWRLLQPRVRALWAYGRRHLPAAKRMPSDGRALSHGQRLLRRARLAGIDEGGQRPVIERALLQGRRRHHWALRQWPCLQPSGGDLPSRGEFMQRDRRMLLRHCPDASLELPAGPARDSALHCGVGSRLQRSWRAQSWNGVREQRRLLRIAVRSESDARWRALRLRRRLRFGRREMHDGCGLLPGPALHDHTGFDIGDMHALDERRRE